MSASQFRFASLGLSDGVLRGLAEAGCEAPSALQAAAIPLLLAGRDLIAEADAGCGKTLAYVLPLLTRIEPACRCAQALVLTAGDDTALRVAETVAQCARRLPGIDVWPLHRQSAALRQRQAARGAQVVVGTPRRFMHHLADGPLALDAATFLVLDEADVQVHSGFAEDIEALLARLPPSRQTAVFSAAPADALHRLSAWGLHRPARVNGAGPADAGADGAGGLPAHVRERHWQIGALSRFGALNRLIEMEPEGVAMLVCVRRPGDARHLAEQLRARAYAAEALDAAAPLAEREHLAARLRRRQLDIVTGTDLAFGGLDLSGLSHVVSYDPPLDIAGYTRRLDAARGGEGGGTAVGAGGSAGGSAHRVVAILLLAAREMGLLHRLEHAFHRSIPPLELPERFR